MKKCKNCNTGLSAKEKYCPTCGRKQATKTPKMVASLLIMLALIVVAIWFSAGGEAERDPVLTGTPTPGVPGSQWLHMPQEDEESSYAAVVRSMNTVTFGFPYHEPQRGALMLGGRPGHGGRVMLSMERGQFSCGHGGCKVLVRFGEGPSVAFEAARASSGDSGNLLIEDYSLFVERLLAVDTVSISTEVYREGSPVFTFNVTGLDEEEFKPSTMEYRPQWEYRISEDSIADGFNHSAFLSSSNTVNFSSPYSGAQRAELMLREHVRFGEDVLISIDKGQLLCRPYRNCVVLIRFDDQEAQEYPVSKSSDGGSDVLFIGNYSRFLENLAEADRLRIAVEVYKEGAQVFDFDISGFDPGKYRSGD